MFVTFTLTSLPACRTQADEESAEAGPNLQRSVHPTAENIPSDEAVDYVIPQRRPEGRSVLHVLARRLSEAEQIGSIGALEGTREEMIGKIADIATGADGTLYLLDARYNEVRIYDAKGAFVRAFGGPGQGPKAFMRPGVITRDRAGRLLVADQARGAFKLFERKGSSFVETETVSYKMVQVDLCTLEGKLYLRGAKVGNVKRGSIHVYSASGELERSFGTVYKTDHPHVRLRLSEGTIACSEEAQTIVSTFHDLPTMYGYTPDGELKWTSKLKAFVPYEVIGMANGGARFNLGKRESDIVMGMTAIPEGYVLIQVAHRTPKDMIEKEKMYSALHSYLMAAETGEGVYVGSSLPPIYAVTRDRIIAGVNDPFPQVQIYRYAHPGGRSM